MKRHPARWALAAGLDTWNGIWMLASYLLTRDGRGWRGPHPCGEGGCRDDHDERRTP